ncbi:hypothetical protein DY000_02001889 [Brassica cretica]|uniref:Uncharacterized protein n=1 Tax=Brassica cretica TaxID=69181 RepID=A0ABQ7BVD2_BRACR|nr:hypothetical protein DY000_02001889 [Brassica cretica]
MWWQPPSRFDSPSPCGNYPASSGHQSATEAEIFIEVLESEVDLSSDPWPQVPSMDEGLRGVGNAPDTPHRLAVVDSDN